MLNYVKIYYMSVILGGKTWIFGKTIVYLQ